jgi:hypothetical protein
MRSAGGAISGVEFGVEPQTNTPSDLEYRLDISKFLVNVDGNPAGILDEEINPVSTIVYSPESDGASLTTDDSIAGDAIGDNATIRTVQYMLRNLADFSYVDTQGNTIPWGPNNIGGLTVSSSVSWSIPHNLPTGNYRLYVRAIDTAGNVSDWNIRDFFVVSPDAIPPAVIVQFPLDNGDPISPAETLLGNASDADSNIQTVQYMLRNLADFSYVDTQGNTIPWGPNNIGGLTVSSSVSWSIPHNLPTGNYRLYVRAIDTAGNVSDWVIRDFVNDVAS